MASITMLFPHASLFDVLKSVDAGDTNCAFVDMSPALHYATESLLTHLKQVLPAGSQDGVSLRSARFMPPVVSADRTCVRAGALVTYARTVGERKSREDLCIDGPIVSVSFLDDGARLVPGALFVNSKKVDAIDGFIDGARLAASMTTDPRDSSNSCIWRAADSSHWAVLASANESFQSFLNGYRVSSITASDDTHTVFVTVLRTAKLSLSSALSSLPSAGAAAAAARDAKTPPVYVTAVDWEGVLALS